MLGNDEGLNIVVSAVVLKRTWIEDENVVIGKDEPKMDLIDIDDSDEDDENMRDHSVLM